MKKIRILRNTGADLPRFTEGQVSDVADEIADMLCGLKLAELLRTIPDNPLQAVPENPSIVAAEVNPKPRRHSKTKPESKEQDS